MDTRRRVLFRQLIFQADGDYWHGKDPSTRTHPTVAGNVKRDTEFDAYAAGADWTVLRFWECELLNERDTCKARILRALKEAGTQMTDKFAMP